MSKGLDALKEINIVFSLDTCKMVKEHYDTIEKELKRLDEYDNTEYSALIESHKKLLKEKKALEIIKEKMVNVGDFIDTFVVEGLSYQHYLDYHDNYSYKLLTQEEYDFLRKELAHDNNR